MSTSTWEAYSPPRRHWRALPSFYLGDTCQHRRLRHRRHRRDGGVIAGQDFLQHGGLHLLANGRAQLRYEGAYSDSNPFPCTSLEAIINTRYASLPYKRFLVGCSAPFMRLAQHLTALRAWCKQCSCLVGKSPTCSVLALQGFEGIWSYDYTAMHDMSTPPLERDADDALSCFFPAEVSWPAFFGIVPPRLMYESTTGARSLRRHSRLTRNPIASL